MEEFNQQPANPNPQPQSTGFSQTPSGKKPRAGKYILILVALIALAFGGYLIFRGTQETEPSPTPTPFFGQIEDNFETPAPEPVDKEEIEIEVLNGTGIAGEAAFLQGQLRTLGYTEITAGNADRQDFTQTRVLYSTTTPSEIIDEIVDKLRELYQSVDSQSSATLSVDIQVTTGLRKGASPKPSPSPTPSPSPAASPSPSPSPTP